MTTRVERTDTPRPAGFVRGAIDHGEARRRVLENVPRERARRSDDKKAAKAEKKAQKKEKQKADLADSAQFKGFDKVVVAELHFDDDDVKKSGFDLPFDAEKTCACGVRGSTLSTRTP